MDLVTIFSSISKIAIVAFVITFIVIAYEIYLLSKKKEVVYEENPEVALPDFTEGNLKKIKSTPISHNYAKEALSKKQIALLGALLIVFGVTASAGLLYVQQNYQTPDEAIAPIPGEQLDEDTPELPPTSTPAVEVQNFDTLSTSATPSVTLTTTPSAASISGTLTLTPSPSLAPSSSLSPSPSLSATPTLSQQPEASPSSSQTTPTEAPTELPESGTIMALTIGMVLLAIALIGFGLVM